MTFKEKLKQEHNKIANKYFGCPKDLEYEKNNKFCSQMSCDECWNREIPGTEEKTIKNISDNGREFICSECGVNLIDFTEKKCNEDKEYYLEFFNCSYCPNCGKKVAK